MFLLRKRRWLFIPLGIILSLSLLSRLEFFAFRQTEEEVRTYFAEKERPAPQFGRYSWQGRFMRYIRTGAPAQPLILFVHGSPGSSSDYLGFLADSSLCARAQLVSVDRPGFGYSGFGNVERSLEKQAEALQPLLTMYGRKGAILVGHSYGGPLIAQMALDYPEQVQGLLIAAGSIDPELEPQAWWQHAVNALAFMIPEAFVTSNREIMALKGELGNMQPRWQDIVVPVMVVHGEDDRLVPVANVDFAKEQITNSRELTIEVIPNEDHFIIWTEQERLIRHLHDLLDDLK